MRDDGRMDRPGFLIAVADGALQKYMQTHPFLDGPDGAMNARCLEAVRANFRARRVSGPAQPVSPRPNEAVPPGDFLAALVPLFDAARIAPEARQRLIDDFGWKAQYVPPGAGNILVVGHGDGREMLFLRARAPRARILGIDWEDRAPAALASAARAEIRGGDVLAELGKLGGGFDVVFSNHVLEHSYDPDRLIGLIASCLAPGGRLISALPLDGVADGAYTPAYARFLADPSRLRRVDMDYVDPGHPWKSTAGDVAQALSAAGLDDIAMFYRPNHVTRDLPISRPELENYRRRGLLLNRVVFGPLRCLLQGLFRDRPPRLALKVLFALERKAWFGANGFKNNQSPEILVTARKP